MMHATSASLLGRMKDGQDDAWGRLVDLYTPLIHRWLTRQGVRADDAQDLAQDVLAVVVRRFPEFQHNQRVGAFRAWLRTITVNRVREFWRAKKITPAAHGGTDFGGLLDQLEDSDNPLRQEWDREHDLYVTRRLLAMLEPQFEPKTWKAFQGFVLEDRPAADVAASLGMTVNAVFIAKSRVMARLRQEAEGLID